VLDDALRLCGNSIFRLLILKHLQNTYSLWPESRVIPKDEGLMDCWMTRLRRGSYGVAGRMTGVEFNRTENNERGRI